MKQNAAKLIEDGTDRELKVGDTTRTFRKEQVEITGFSDDRARGNPASSGRVYLRFLNDGHEGEYFPGVINAKIVR